METLPVHAPPMRRFVDTSVEGQTIARLVFNDAGLLVKHAPIRNGTPTGVARNGKADFERAARNEPTQQFKRLVLFGQLRAERHLGQSQRDRLLRVQAALDRFDLARLELTTDDEAPVSLVANQPLDATSRECENARGKKSCGPVVARGRSKGRLEKIVQ